MSRPVMVVTDHGQTHPKYVPCTCSGFIPLRIP